MKQFIGVKLINATPMTRQEYNDFRGWKLPPDELGSDRGYLVEYTDGGRANTSEYAGYVSWSPEEVFNKSYRPREHMTFGLAVEAMKKGLAVTRAGWNGKGMFLYYVPANEYVATTEVAKRFFIGQLVPYVSYIAMKTADDKVVPWLASQTDVLAEDWLIKGVN